MIKRVLPALLFASAFAAGIVGGAHDYVAQISGATEGASLLVADSQHLAYGGYTQPSPKPSPSPSPSASHPSSGGGMPSENSGTGPSDHFGGGSSGAGMGGGFNSPAGSCFD
jgi:hypothetical protein